MATENENEEESSEIKNSNQISSLTNELYIISDKNNKYSLNLTSEDDNLNISANTTVNNISNTYSKVINLDDLCEISYFKKQGLENLEEIIEELRKLLKENNPNIIEFTNLILLNIPTGSKKIPEILINLDYVINYEEKIIELENSNKLLYEEIKELKNQIVDLNVIIVNLNILKRK